MSEILTKKKKWEKKLGTDIPGYPRKMYSGKQIILHNKSKYSFERFMWIQDDIMQSVGSKGKDVCVAVCVDSKLI